MDKTNKGFFDRQSLYLYLCSHMHGITTTQQLKMSTIINWSFKNVTKKKPKMTRQLFP